MIQRSLEFATTFGPTFAGLMLAGEIVARVVTIVREWHRHDLA